MKSYKDLEAYLYVFQVLAEAFSSSYHHVLQLSMKQRGVVVHFRLKLATYQPLPQTGHSCEHSRYPWFSQPN